MKKKLTAILIVLLMTLPLPAMAFEISLTGLVTAIIADVGGQVLAPVARRVWEGATASVPSTTIAVAITATTKDVPAPPVPQERIVKEEPEVVDFDLPVVAADPSDQPQ